MREIKFRGKRLDNKEWVYGYYVYCPDIDKMNEPDRETLPEYKSYIFDDSFNSFEIDPETLTQYTGLKDKNGVEIYEGDVVKNADENLQVFYNASTACFDVQYLGGDCEPMIAGGTSEEYEAIGNIYENPELLRK